MFGGALLLFLISFEICKLIVKLITPSIRWHIKKVRKSWKLVEKVWTPLMSKTRVRAKAVTMTAKMIIRSVISIAKKKGRIRKATGLANTARIAIQIIVVLLRKLVVSSITFSSSRRLMTSWASSLGVPSSAITRDSFSGPASSKYYMKYSRASSWSFGGNFRRYFVNLSIWPPTAKIIKGVNVNIIVLPHMEKSNFNFLIRNG